MTTGRVALIDPTIDPRWDKFVESHPFGWITHLSDWKHVIEESFKHIKGYYLAIEDTEKDAIKAALPLFEVQSWLTGKRLVSIPFATLCDPLVSTSDDADALLESSIELSRRLGTSYIEIRTLKSSRLIQDARFGRTNFFKHHYLLLDENPEKLKKSFHRTCVRQRISRAAASGLSLKVAEDESDLLGFFNLYMMTRKRLGLPTQPYRFISNMWKTLSLKKLITLHLAIYRNRAIAGIILFKLKDRVSIEFSASDDSFLNLSPVHYLFWEALKTAFNEGYRIIDFGKTSPNNEGLMAFKNRWGSTMMDLPQYYYPKHACNITDERENTAAYKLVKRICSSAPDMVLPHVGRFCYRHLG